MGFFRKLLDAARNLSARQLFAVACVFSVVMVLVGGNGLKTLFFDDSAPLPVAVKIETVDFTKFLKLVDSGTLREVRFASTRLMAWDTQGQEYILNHDRRFQDIAFPEELARKGISVLFPNLNQTSTFDYVIAAIQLAISLMMMAVFVGVGGFMLISARKRVNPSWPTVARNVAVRFSDVAGQEETKFELEEIRNFLKDPGFYARSGAKVPRGVLLVGPPGTGKTMLAEALAGETGVNFIFCTGSDFSNMFAGTGRDKIEKLFRKARKSSPCIVFIDEIDSLARARGGSTSDVGRESDTTLNQLLTEMNGFGKRGDVIVIGATNRIDVLDPAILRPGRFDRQVFMGLPDLADRVKILEVHVKTRTLDPDVDLTVVARGTPGCSGADLEQIVNEAATFAARDKRVVLTLSDFEEARDKTFMGPKRSGGILDDYERRLTAYHEAGHAVVATWARGADPVHQVTLIPRGGSLGHVMQLPDKEWKAVPKSRYLARLDVMVAGRIAEEMIFGEAEITSGAASDIAEATKLATAMVTTFGMSERIGMRLVSPTENGYPEVAEREIQRLIDEACARARKMLAERPDDLENVARALLDKETLTGPELRTVLKAA